ncbi:hypothetical protein C7A12_12135 [Pseudomonas fluorescens]|nr:hypothetical protein C7A12_12135 [Pseudomonas fluorescens]PRW79154.1 hypothetical protein C7A13_11670 [Pseudomonas fluorescens]
MSRKTTPFPNQNPISVGAGLPAILTTRCIRQTEVMLSQASQLPHLTELCSGMCDNAHHIEPTPESS